MNVNKSKVLNINGKRETKTNTRQDFFRQNDISQAIKKITHEGFGTSFRALE